MKAPLISQKMEKEIVKTFKGEFIEFMRSLEPYFLSFGFSRVKDGYFKKSLNTHDEFFEIIGHRGNYLSFELSIGVRYKKFDKLFGGSLNFSFKKNETNYRLITHEKSFKHCDAIKPYFDCGEPEDIERATQTIKYAFENFAPEFYGKNSSLLNIRDYIFETDISNQDYLSYKFQLPDGNAIGLVFFITYLCDDSNIKRVLDHYKKLFEGRNVYQEFEDFYVNKIMLLDREEALKKLV